MAAQDLERFDLTGPLPVGLRVLEASAGTGKTYAIAGLVARYVAAGLRLPRLLVVTFTRAATAELRERVRTRLVAAADHLDRVAAGAPPAAPDPVLTLLATGSGDEVDLRRRRLVAALTEFDAATISTIHGFCQHVLHGVGLAGDVERDALLIEDQRDLVEAVCDDLLVRTYHSGDADLPRIRRGELVDVANKLVSNPDAVLVPEQAEGEVGRLRVELARQVRDELDRRKRLARLVSYDDQLTRLRDTLADPVHGATAAARLRSQYDVALIDEFQDTDPVQWDIFRRVFGGGGPTTAPGVGSALVLIGDPKQAIYTFRGADVYAYLAASRAAHGSMLDVNWRSDAGLLGAYNALFDDAPLGHADIRYMPVAAAPPHHDPRLVRAGGEPPGAPLRLRLVRREGLRTVGPHELIYSALARQHVARDVAAEIVRLLGENLLIADRDPDGTEHRPRHLSTGDVAVLARTNAEAALVQRTLRDVGLPAVINGVGSVFGTAAAAEWLRLIEALERPASPFRAHAVALTSFLGWTAERVAAAGDDEWAGVHELLHHWAAVLRERSVASLWRTISLQQRMPERLLARPDGERLLTDLEHVGELLHAAASAEQLGVTALGGWVRERMGEAPDDVHSEERARRLESDDEAVQVLTIHRSKGLEFPIVLCPFLWSPGPVDWRIPTFHDPDAGDRRTIDVGGPGEAGFDDRKKLAEREARGEELRLLYVALTRAKHRAIVWWTPANNSSDRSPLARVLFCRSDGGPVRACEKVTSAPEDALARRRLEEIAARAPGLIAVEDVPVQPSRVAFAGLPEQHGPLDAAPFDRGLDHTWRRTSYSALTAAAGHGEPLVSSERDEASTEDEGLVVAAPGGGGGPVVAAPGGGEGPVVAAPGGGEASDPLEARLRAVSLPLADLRGGTEVGTFVHGVLERVDFAAPDVDAALDEAVRDQRRRRDVELGLSDTDAVAGLRRVLETPLGPLAAGLRLRDVGEADRLDELAFELPLAGGLAAGQTGGRLTTAAVGDLLGRHLAAADPLVTYPRRLGEPSFHRAVRGYLTGSVDLVLRVPGAEGSRFLVVDYKTNWLGDPHARPDDPSAPLTAWHYRPAALAEAMQRGHYPLQALLYTVALHRYLRWRVAAYDPDRHLGGSLYLFVRGMAGAETPLVDGGPCGVFSWRPSTALVLELSDLLDRGADREVVPA